MRQLRLLPVSIVLAACTVSFARQDRTICKVAETLDSTGVYTSPNTRASVISWVPPNAQLLIRRTSNPNWVEVLLQRGNFGFSRRIHFDITTASYSVARRHRSTLLASRGASPTLTGSTGSYLADKALTFQGTPYEWGGNNLVSGVDCSGFVKELVGAIGGPSLPRTAAEQALVGQPLHRLEELRPGDRLYFKERTDTKISHTGIYIGNARFVHASHGKGKVSTDSLLNPGWRKMLVAARR